MFLEKQFIMEKVNGRTVQLDEIGESLGSDQRIETPKVVPEIIPETEPKDSTCYVETSTETVDEPHKT